MYPRPEGQGFTGHPDKWLLNANGSNELLTYEKKISTIEASGDDYIRFVDGTQVCWGFAAINNSSQTIITYPVQFLAGSGTDFKYSISCAVNSRSTFYLTPNVGGKTATAMTSNSAGQNMWWIAYGKWK